MVRKVRFPELETPDWLRQRCAEKIMTVKEMAQAVGCSVVSIYRTMEKYGIRYERDFSEINTENHRRRREKLWPKLDDREWLVQKHDVESLGLKQIAEIVGCSTNTVMYALRRHGIKSHPNGFRLAPIRRHGRTIPELEDSAWLHEQLVAQQRTLESVSIELNCSIGTVGRAARRHRIQKVNVGSQTHMKPWSIPKLADEAWLRQQYIANGRRAQEIAAELNCSAWAVQAALGRFRILKYPHKPTKKIDASLPVGTIRKDGYILVYKPDHPFAGLKGYIPQHRLMCEEAIGRLLTPMEEVHHINETRDDNRISNFLITPDFRTHRHLHNHPPPWVPRCQCCNHPRPQLLAARPSWVPLLFDKAATYGPIPEGCVVTLVDPTGRAR